MSTDAGVCYPSQLQGAKIEHAELPQEREPLMSRVAVSVVPPPSNTIDADELLLKEVGLGSRDALSALFRRHGQVVFNSAYRLLRNHAEAEDVRQEVFLYLFQKAALFDIEKGTAISWIIQITYHRAINRRKSLISRGHYKTDQFDEDLVPSDVGLPSTDAIDGRAMLKRLRSTLSGDQCLTLEMHFFEGYTLREIAEKSGQSLGNVRNHYYRGMECLRSGLFSEKRD
ncbi:RNA polymerase sigma factor [Granulicella paludicola]|uniref:RNA polymerase sigma factor n=1 Tax=Granulicella paludicola TaxID=474951 RepID=UPI0021DF5858|nr:sigma-70 family RNA polymerase sigma factor [Granulicella paludicola]